MSLLLDSEKLPLGTSPSMKSEVESRQAPGPMALDQWRGLALILVLISHGLYYTDRVHGIGRVGVNLFFFISGILVFRSLSADKSRHGIGLIGAFWRKRLRRLYPALLTYTAAAGAIVFLTQGMANLPPRADIPSFFNAAPYAIGYVINYMAETPYILGHLWSLACEMQFYLLAPLIFLAGGKTFGRSITVFGSILLLLVGLGAAYPILMKGHFDDTKYQFQFAVWPMMLGLVCEYAKRWFLRIPAATARLIIRASLVIFVPSSCLMLFGVGMKSVVVGTGALLVGPCLLAYLFGMRIGGLPGRILAWLGERTYSIYLWQQPFTICAILPSFLHPAGAVVSIGVGAAWFHWFERPFLSSGAKKKPPASA